MTALQERFSTHVPLCIANPSSHWQLSVQLHCTLLTQRYTAGLL